MATVQDRNGPGAGTKVDLGMNAPVKEEAAGHVEQGSLAAESYDANGKFAENRDADPVNAEDQGIPSARTTNPSSSSATVIESQQGGAAPSYISSQFTADYKGPHGKKLEEGGFDDKMLQSGQKKAFESEPGSTNDPSRLAEAKFLERNAVGPDAPPDGGVTELSTKTAFDGLNHDVSA